MMTMIDIHVGDHLLCSYLYLPTFAHQMILILIHESNKFHKNTILTEEMLPVD